MVQKKHKKRRHNKKPEQQGVEQVQAEAEDEPKELTRAEKREAKKAAKAEEEKRAAKAAAKDKDAKPGVFTRIKNWFKAVRSEMQRVVWPTRTELINASLIVIGALVFFGVYIAIIDNVVLVPLNWIASIGS